jgi:hypothetical protein
MRPRLMLLDEVTSALDPELVADVLDVIRELAHGGMTMLIATHEMGFARDIASRVCFLADGQIVEQAPPGQLFTQPSDERTRRFLRRIVDAGRMWSLDRSGAALDDLELVPVRILELEHGRNTRPPKQVPDLDALLPHGGALGFGIGNHEPDAGVGPGVRPGDQRDRGGRARGRDRDPAEALAHPHVQPLLEAKRADEELHRLVLVADRDSHGANVGDGGLGHDDLLASLDE